MLANNALTGEIPPELGNYKSLLWLHLVNNQLSRPFPLQLTNIGTNSMATFEQNQQNDRVTTISGECMTMKRWIPTNYPPLAFMYTILTRNSCRSLWDRFLNGYGIFPVCVSGVQTFWIAGYVQLNRNQLSNEVPPEIVRMQNFNSLNNLTELSKFNVSYNPYISSIIPINGQLTTFGYESYPGNPLLLLPSFNKIEHIFCALHYDNGLYCKWILWNRDTLMLCLVGGFKEGFGNVNGKDR
ncbi:hypothetical protein ACSBR1_042758 [Camellia fascicularis]